MNIDYVGLSCVGCRGCVQICPLRCISFEENIEGFLYPHIDEGRCIQCGLCAGVCPVLYPYRNSISQRYFAAWATDRNLLMQSSSGGVFSVVAEEMIKNGAAVCACSYDEKSMPFHTITMSKEDLQLMRGSKYVQSNIGDAYLRIRELLKGDTRVFFVGTPCQVAGLYRFVGGENDLLYTADIICHGVPSRPLFASYMKWLEGRHGGEIDHYRFRSKDRHAWSLTEQFYVRRPVGRMRKVERIASLSPYYYGFLKGMLYRECCYQCQYSNMTRPGDITLGDFWGVEEVASRNYNLDGVSAVIVNSQKGSWLMECIRHKLNLGEVTQNQISIHNGNLLRPTFRPAERNYVYVAWREHGFDWLARQYLKSPDHLKDQIKNIIPNRIRQKIKHIKRSIMQERTAHV